MTRIILISCVSKKITTQARADQLYISPFFKYNYEYAKKLGGRIFILSAKYGLLKPSDIISPYDKTLNKMKDEEVRKWSEEVIKKLSEETDLESDEFIILAGSKYRKYLLPRIKNYELPLRGLGIGRQLSYLKERTR